MRIGSKPRARWCGRRAPIVSHVGSFEGIAYRRKRAAVSQAAIAPEGPIDEQVDRASRDAGGGDEDRGAPAVVVDRDDQAGGGERDAIVAQPLDELGGALGQAVVQQIVVV